MSTLKGTVRDPSIVDSPLDMVALKAKTKAEDKVIDAIHDEAVVWRKWRKTPAGDAISQLAEPKLAQLHRIVAKTMRQWKLEDPDLTANEVREIVAEARGAIEVWNTILYRPAELEKQLAILKESKKKDVGKEVPKEVKKYS